VTAAGELIEVDMRELRRDGVAAVEFAVNPLAELLFRHVAAEVGMGLYCACAAPGQSRNALSTTRPGARRAFLSPSRGCRAKGPASSPLVLIALLCAPLPPPLLCQTLNATEPITVTPVS